MIYLVLSSSKLPVISCLLKHGKSGKNRTFSMFQEAGTRRQLVWAQIQIYHQTGDIQSFNLTNWWPWTDIGKARNQLLKFSWIATFCRRRRDRKISNSFTFKFRLETLNKTFLLSCVSLFPTLGQQSVDKTLPKYWQYFIFQRGKIFAENRRFPSEKPYANDAFWLLTN